jgi:hypothetical protein
MDKLTAQDVIDLVIKSAQRMRESGESDLRSIIWLCSGLRSDMTAGKTREAILSELEEEEVELCSVCGEEWSGTSCGAEDCGWIK